LVKGLELSRDTGTATTPSGVCAGDVSKMEAVRDGWHCIERALPGDADREQVRRTSDVFTEERQ